MQSVQEKRFNSTLSYKSVATYFEISDSLEYVRDDVPTVSRRIDASLTLILDMENREPIGIKLKGFKSFYLKHIKPSMTGEDKNFFLLINILEKILTVAGDDIFRADDKKNAYEQAISIAREDSVQVLDLPNAA